MKAHHTKWILPAAVAFFFLAANAWADGKRDQRHRKPGPGIHSPGHHQGNHHADIRRYPRHPGPNPYRPHRRPQRHGYHRKPHHHHRSKVYQVQVFPPPLLLPPLPPFFWPHH